MAKAKKADSEPSGSGSSRCGCRCCAGWYFKLVGIPTALAALAHIVFKAVAENQSHDGWGGVPRTLKEETDMCPAWVSWAFSVELGAVARGQSAILHEEWGGSYFIAFKWMLDLLMSIYEPRHANFVNIPTSSGSPPDFEAAGFVAPDRDIDSPLYMVPEHYLPRFIWNMVFSTFFNCGMGIVRGIDADPFDDAMINGTNSWGPILAPGQTKQQFLLSFYDNHTLWDKSLSRYPSLENDLTSMFFKADIWADGVEKALAFDLIAAHRVEPIKKVVGGETLRFIVAFNDMKDVEVRPGFGKYGTDMYFTAEGLPAMVVTTNGKEVMRGDKDWQYWKFVWRSTLLGTVTLIDHLHLTHFRSANLLARASRKTLPPNHPLRRLMSIFTFGSIFINNIAMHLLVGHRSPLHRSTPFKTFEALQETVPKIMKPLRDWHKRLLDNTEWEKMPQILKDTPYYSDGRILSKEVKKMVSNMMVAMGWKDGSGKSCTTLKDLHDTSAIRFLKHIQMDEATEGYDQSLSSASSCEQLMAWLTDIIWTVTGWHRHVGKVADFVSDPALAGFSWREGESFTAPRQAMIMSAVAAFTGTPQPKLIEDYTHLFVGIEHGEKMTEVWNDFRKALQTVETEVVTRNKGRTIKNSHSNPAEVECSVAV